MLLDVYQDNQRKIITAKIAVNGQTPSVSQRILNNMSRKVKLQHIDA